MKIQQSYFSRVDNPLEEKEKSFGEVCLLMHGQGLQILLMSGVSESSDSHNFLFWSHFGIFGVKYYKKRAMYTLS